MPTAYHIVHYRLFDPGAAPIEGESFETLCRRALGVVDATQTKLWARAGDRICDSIDGGARQILLNRVADLTSAVFGELCLIEQGGLQALLELRASTVKLSEITTAEVFDLSEKTAPAGSQFVRGMVYWLAIGNHLFLVKMQPMTSDHIQAYFEWLLKRCTATLAPEVAFRLRAELDKSETGHDVGDIRSLRVSSAASARLTVAAADLGSTVPAHAIEVEAREIVSSRKVGERAVFSEQARQVVEVVFGRERADSLLQSLGKKEDLAVDTAVSVRGRRSAATRQRLREIAGDLADMTDAKVQIEGKDGKLSAGDAILRTRMPFETPHAGSALLDFHNVADQLQKVYVRFVEDGKIEA